MTNPAAAKFWRRPPRNGDLEATSLHLNTLCAWCPVACIHGCCEHQYAANLAMNPQSREVGLRGIGFGLTRRIDRPPADPPRCARRGLPEVARKPDRRQRQRAGGEDKAGLALLPASGAPASTGPESSAHAVGAGSAIAWPHSPASRAEDSHAFRAGPTSRSIGYRPSSRTNARGRC